MFKITFEAKNMKDLQDQVNDLVGLDNAPINTDEPEALNENPNQQVHIAPKQIMSAPVAPVPAPVIQPESTPQPVSAVQAVRPEPTPTNDTPWDARIHSSSKSKIKSGDWKKRKGISIEFYEQVMAEISGQTVAPVTVAPVTPPPAPTAPPVEAPAMQQPVAPVAPVPVAPPVQQYAPAPVPDSNKPAHSFDTFRSNFAQVMAQLKGEGHLTPEYIQSLNTHFGVTELWELASHDDKLGDLFQNFADFGWITKVD